MLLCSSTCHTKCIRVSLVSSICRWALREHFFTSMSTFQVKFVMAQADNEFRTLKKEAYFYVCWRFGVVIRWGRAGWLIRRWSRGSTLWSESHKTKHSGNTDLSDGMNGFMKENVVARFSQNCGSSVMVGRFGVVGPLRPSPRTLRLEMDQTSLSSAQGQVKEGGGKNQNGVIWGTEAVKDHTITRGHAQEGQVPESLRTRSMANLQRREGSSEYSELWVNLRHRE